MKVSWNIKNEWKWLVKLSSKQHIGEKMFKYNRTAVCQLSSYVWKNVKHVGNTFWQNETFWQKQSNNRMTNQSLLVQNEYERKINYDLPYGPLTTWKAKSRKSHFWEKLARMTRRQTGNQACRQTGRQAGRQADKQVTLRQVKRKIKNRQTDRQTDRQRDRQTDRQTDRNKNRQR